MPKLTVVFVSEVNNAFGRCPASEAVIIPVDRAVRKDGERVDFTGVGVVCGKAGVIFPMRGMKN